MAAYQFDYSNPCHVYFCGIGGISMSGLAEILLLDLGIRQLAGHQVDVLVALPGFHGGGVTLPTGCAAGFAIETVRGTFFQVVKLFLGGFDGYHLLCPYKLRIHF